MVYRLFLMFSFRLSVPFPSRSRARRPSSQADLSVDVLASIRRSFILIAVYFEALSHCTTNHYCSLRFLVIPLPALPFLCIYPPFPYISPTIEPERVCMCFYLLYCTPLYSCSLFSWVYSCCCVICYSLVCTSSAFLHNHRTIYTSSQKKCKCRSLPQKGRHEKNLSFDHDHAGSASAASASINAETLQCDAPNGISVSDTTTSRSTDKRNDKTNGGDTRIQVVFVFHRQPYARTTKACCCPTCYRIPPKSRKDTQMATRSPDRRFACV